jgi:2-oxoglutarate ferredoxin oxidoreductase subunit beta
MRRVTKSIQEALKHRGLSLIEVITPCVTLYARRNRLGDGLNLLKYYYDQSVIEHGADTRTIDISYQGKLVCGKFVHKEKPTFLDAMNTHMMNVLGDDYELYGRINNEND